MGRVAADKKEKVPAVWQKQGPAVRVFATSMI
jgi:hypothetical protein